MANWYVSSVKYAAIAQFAISTAYTVGQLVRQLAAPTAANARVFKCTTAGTSAGTEPTWNLGDGATTTSGTATFTQVAGREAEQSTGNWAAPFGTLAGANLIATVAGDVIYVAADHSESYAAATDVQGTIVPRICVTAGSAVPPVEASLSRGAAIETTGNFGLNLINSCLYRGFDFRSGVGGTNTAGNMTINASNKFEDCRFKLGTSSTSAQISFGSAATARGSVELTADCRFEFSHVSQSFANNFSEVLINDCPNFLVGPTYPTGTLFNGGSSNGNRSIWIVRNTDLSNAAGQIAPSQTAGNITLENCKLHASATFGVTINNSVKNGVRIHNCTSSTSINNALVERGAYTDLEIATDLYRTGGATDGVTPCSWKITTKTNSQVDGQRASPPRIGKRINATGSALTFTVEAILMTNGLLSLTRAKIWGEFSILTSATSPVEELKSTRTSLLDTTAIQTSTEAWDAGLPARANSTARSIGYLQKVASNPGRVFRVTTGGTTAASEPAAYATAVDGDTFADGTATIRCCKRVKFQVTATPARKGLMFFIPQIQAVSGEIMHVDPKITVT